MVYIPNLSPRTANLLKPSHPATSLGVIATGGAGTRARSVPDPPPSKYYPILPDHDLLSVPARTLPQRMRSSKPFPSLSCQLTLAVSGPGSTQPTQTTTATSRSRSELPLMKPRIWIRTCSWRTGLSLTAPVWGI
ncbi:hypothetical protein BD779DRAFT_784337 [Infundibulicybe gibba]|nr:hypothetical protein BD779DRAFT_784337 [Infundibulicybe gibba]